MAVPIKVTEEALSGLQGKVVIISGTALKLRV